MKALLHASVAVAVANTGVAGQLIVVGAGNAAITGAVISCTLIVWLADDELPHASVAVQVLVTLYCPAQAPGVVTSAKVKVVALTASDAVIVPVQCEYFALEGLGKLLNTIKIVQQKLNTDLTIEGILLTMYDSRLRLSNQVVEEVKMHFQEMYI